MKTADELLREAALWMPGIVAALDDDIDPDETFITVEIKKLGSEDRVVVKRSLSDFLKELDEWAEANGAAVDVKKDV